MRTMLRGNVVTPEGVVRGGTVVLEDDRIVDVLDGEAASGRAADVDLGEGWVLPGFIDVHVHGGYGADFMDATVEAIDTIASFHGRHGTTSMLATTMTAPKADIDAVLRAAKAYMDQGPLSGARIVGVHLEGPFISPKWPGAQNPAFIVPPDIGWIEEWTASYPGLVRLLTLAPEAPGAAEAIRLLRRRGVVVAAGHTDATYAQVVAAADLGLAHAVHTFNAMTGLHHREPGVVGAAMTDPRIAAEVIADGIHVHPAAVTLLTRAKTNADLLLVTDAISAAGLGDGAYRLGGLDVTVRDGAARLAHGDSLAGSTLTMIGAFRFMVERIGVSVEEASRFASANAARRFGLDDVGAVRPGAKADLVLLTPDLDIVRVYRDGRAIS